jgi:hypothetical protein
MQEKHLFEYAVIRVMPRVEREEFLNIGVIVFCASQNFLQLKFTLDEKRLLCLYEKFNVEELKDYLKAIKHICAGGKEGGTIGELPIASRFRWLTAARSTVVQASKVHPGFCDDPEETLERLYCELVL